MKIRMAIVIIIVTIFQICGYMFIKENTITFKNKRSEAALREGFGWGDGFIRK